MKTLTLLLALSLSPFARADWTPRVSCDGGAMVVDGLESLDGVKASQLVVRNGEAIRYLGSVVPNGIGGVERGEWIVSDVNFAPDASFTGVLKQETRNSTSELYRVHGKFLDWSRYEIRVTYLFTYPGMSFQEGKTLGNWVFNDCRRVR